jgi:hypothetical protein
LPRRAIGIEEARTGQVAQAAGESRFPGGNSSSDSDDGARFEHNEQAASKGIARLPSTLRLAKTKRQRQRDAREPRRRTARVVISARLASKIGGFMR